MPDGHDPQACRIFLWCLQAKLNRRQTEVIMWRYLTKLTQEKVGKKINHHITKQAVSLIEIAAIKKLKYFMTNRKCM